MASKTLTIKDTTYEKLARVKREGESFSDLFERLAEKEKPDVMKYAGILNEKEANALKRRVKAYRKAADLSFKKRMESVKKALA